MCQILITVGIYKRGAGNGNHIAEKRHKFWHWQYGNPAYETVNLIAFCFNILV